MEQDRAVNKVLHTLREMFILDEQTSQMARPLLQQLYAAGWEEGKLKRRGNPQKSITLYNIRGQRKVETFESAVEASKQTRIPIRTIYSAIQKDSISVRGYYWRYENSKYDKIPLI